MPRRRGKDAGANKRGPVGGTPPGAGSDIQNRKRTRDPRSKEEMQVDRDPDAIDRNPEKQK